MPSTRLKGAMWHLSQACGSTALC